MKLKICGLRKQADLDLAASLGVDYCGFIFHAQSPRSLSPAEADALESRGMTRVGVFVKQDSREILEIMRLARLDMAQLHGSQDAACCEAIGPERVIRVIWPERYATNEELEKAAREMAPNCASFLLDAGMSGGGAGRALSWKDLARTSFSRPWFLAGGLCAQNIPLALTQCSPGGLDLNSGLESAPGLKCHAKMKAAVDAARKWEEKRQ